MNNSKRTHGGNASGHILRIAIGILLLLAPGAIAIGETVSVNPTQGPPGTKVDFSGTGWLSSESLNIYISPNFGEADELLVKTIEMFQNGVYPFDGSIVGLKK